VPRCYSVRSAASACRSATAKVSARRTRATSFKTQNPLSRIKSYEGGVTYARQTDNIALSARSILFLTRVDKDLIFSETEGRNILGSGTTRTGWSGNTRLTGRFFDESRA